MPKIQKKPKSSNVLKFSFTETLTMTEHDFKGESRVNRCENTKSPLTRLI